MKGGGNRWTDFVRQYADTNKLSYMCALSTPDCKEKYKSKYGSSKKVSQKKEKETMGKNDPREIKKKTHRKRVDTLKKKLEVVKETAENKMMGDEDVLSSLAKVVPSGKAVVPAVSKRGRPKKYASTEEARQAKIKNTVEASKRRQQTKRLAKADAKKEREENIKMTIEDKPRKRGRPKKGGVLSGGVGVSDIQPNLAAYTWFIDLPAASQYQVLRHAVNLVNNSYGGDLAQTLAEMGGWGGLAETLRSFLAPQVPVVTTEMKNKLEKRFKGGATITPDGSPIGTPVSTPPASLTDLPELETLINLVQGTPTPETRQEFLRITRGQMERYLRALRSHFSPLPASNQSRRAYERNIPSYSNPHIVGGVRMLGADPATYTPRHLTAGHWTPAMMPHLVQELNNYKGIVNHFKEHLKEPAPHDPKDKRGVKHFVGEIKRVKKIAEELSGGMSCLLGMMDDDCMSD